MPITETRSSMSKQASFFTLATMVALFSQSLVIPVMSTIPYYDPNSITPPTGGISIAYGGASNGGTLPNIDCNCDNPPHDGGEGGGSHHHHDPTTPSNPTPSGNHGGGGGGGYSHTPPTYTPAPTRPSTPSPTTPMVTPPSGPATPTYTTPTIPTPYVPFVPNAPPYGTPPFSFDPNSPGPFPCTFWRTHPTMIWGLVRWNGNTVNSMFGVGSVAGFGADMNLLQALSNTRTDGLGELYREGTAAMLNALASKSFPYTTQQVKVSFGRAALSSNDAAAAQAMLFKLANEGHSKPANP